MRPTKSSNSSFDVPKRRSHRAFTLVEIMIVVVIIGLLTVLAVMAFQRSRENSQNAILAEDWRSFGHAFRLYNLEFGEWPLVADKGEVPEGMEGRLHSSWTEGSVVNGTWQWANNTNGQYILNYYMDIDPTGDQVQRLDALMDDGDLTTGDFRCVAYGDTGDETTCYLLLAHDPAP